jgi:REP element-mobilizing transposase RayT
MLTRRCTQRRFLLRPDKFSTTAVAYCLGLAAERYGIELHACMVMSNHYHIGVRDVDGRLPEFLRDFHSLLGRCLNAHLGRWENFWAVEPSGALELADAEAIFSKMVYGLTNPVKDDLVERAHHWPGLSSLRYQLTGKELVAKRPWWFFNQGSRLPERVSLRFVRPPGFEDLSEELWRQRLSDAIAKREQEAARLRRQSGRRLLGRKAVRRQSPYSAPKSMTPRRTMTPRVATKNKWLRIERLSRNKRFEQDYRVQLERYRAGREGVVFPFGTYKMRVLYGVACRPPPA